MLDESLPVFCSASRITCEFLVSIIHYPHHRDHALVLQFLDGLTDILTSISESEQPMHRSIVDWALAFVIRSHAKSIQELTSVKHG